MQRLISAICAGAILGAGLVLAFAQPATMPSRNRKDLTVTKAQRTQCSDDAVGHRLSFTSNRFQIISKDGKPLYAGTIRVNPSANPWAIDFEHTEEALKGKTWKGIYVLDGDTLTICDNAPNLDEGRPISFETKSGSGYEVITFKRVAPDRA